jgi:cholinesterase
MVVYHAVLIWITGPAVDGLFVPETPGLLLLHGRFDKSVEIMVGHNGDEGMGYPSLTNGTAFEGKFRRNAEDSFSQIAPFDHDPAYIASSFPNAPPTVLRYITRVLYPPTIPTSGDILEDYDPRTSRSLSVTGYDNAQGRQAFLTSETVISCLTYYLNKAFVGRAYSYIFTTPPAMHGQELYYVFYNGQSTDVFYRPINVTLAHIMQDYWINFARFGNPNAKGLPYFSRWGNDSSLQQLSLADIGPTRDPTDNERCRWWQLGLYI